jgi:hypothetical protein
MAKKTKHLHPDEPLRHRDHSRPVTRRDLLKQGFISGTGMVMGGGVFNMLAYPQYAHALSTDITTLAGNINCTLSATGAGKIPFITFDLGGGANLAGSNVLVGTDGQMDALSERGYSKMGLPSSMIPGTSSAGLSEGIGNAVLNPSANSDYTNNELGIKFHQDSPLLFGILERFTSRQAGEVEGSVIPARSDNDTGNNPHNPMYGIAAAGATGGVVTLIGSQNSESGARSMAPASLINPKIRPTKVDRPSDVTGMIDVGDLTGVLNRNDVRAVMESMTRVSHKKLNSVSTQLAQDTAVKDLVRCGYIKSADIAEKFAGVPVDPSKDSRISDQTVARSTGIFSQAEFASSGEFRKTASVMKMVLDGHAGAGSISMGGYDYHTGDRSTGENRDLRAGRCIGACLEYASRLGKPLMIYVYSDGSVASNGALDTTADNAGNTGSPLGGRGKGEWTGDNSSTACSFFLVFKPGGGISISPGNTLTDPHQIGRFTSDGSVVTSATPAANNVNLLVNTIVANYMSLNGDMDLANNNISQFESLFPNHGLGDVNAIKNLVSFGPL